MPEVVLRYTTTVENVFLARQGLQPHRYRRHCTLEEQVENVFLARQGLQHQRTTPAIAACLPSRKCLFSPSGIATARCRD